MPGPKLETLSDGSGYRIRVRHCTGNQTWVRITLKDEAKAERRAIELAEIGRELSVAKFDRQFGAHLLTRMGAGETTLVQARDTLKKAAKAGAHKSTGPRVTFAQLGEAWTSGRIAETHPDHVKVKRTADKDAERLKILNKAIGKIPVSEFKLADAELAMRTLSKDLSSATRRQYAQIIGRLMTLAVYPLKLIEHSPLPRGFLPKVKRTKATAWLYPDDDARLSACERVPLARRVLYGFLAREGCRVSEALGMTWTDLDLGRGIVRLDENKTDDPRAWALSDGIPAALKKWRGSVSGDLVFNVDNERRLAEVFRADLELAGVDRPELYKRSKSRLPIRVHDLRATFVTLNLAAGRSETWIADRTGHRSSVMIQTYRRAARTAAELGLGGLAPLDVALAWSEVATPNAGHYGAGNPPPRKRAG